MNEELIDQAEALLLRMHESPNESLPAEEYWALVKKYPDHFQSIVDFLLKHDFIETEEDPHTYFLTPETYDLIEQNELESALWGSWSSTQKQEPVEEHDWDVPVDFEFTDEYEPREPGHSYEWPQMPKGLLLLLLVALISWIALQTRKPDPPADTISPEMQERIRRIMEEQGMKDTIVIPALDSTAKKDVE